MQCKYANSFTYIYMAIHSCLTESSDSQPLLCVFKRASGRKSVTVMEVERARSLKIATARKEITALHHKTARDISQTRVTDDF